MDGDQELTISQQDGTIQLEIKLTGILNTYSIADGEDSHGWGTEVAPGMYGTTPPLILR